MSDNEKFEEIYHKYKDIVYRTALKYCGDYALAEDFAQHAFFQLYINFDTIKHENIKSWLSTTVKHRALNHKRNLKREILKGESEDERQDNMFERPADSAEDEFLDTVAAGECKDLHKQILSALLEKNPRWYEAIYLVYFMEVPQVKAAEEFGVSLQVLYSWLHRAKRWVKKKYGVVYEEFKKQKY